MTQTGGSLLPSLLFTPETWRRHMELLIPLNLQDSKPLYEQIYQYIKDEIRRGNMKPDRQLPSSRELAKSLKVSRSTTQLAYEHLRDIWRQFPERDILPPGWTGFCRRFMPRDMKRAERRQTSRIFCPTGQRKGNTFRWIFPRAGLIWNAFLSLPGARSAGQCSGKKKKRFF